MLFHTWVFLVFFAIVWVGYALVRPTRLAMPWLLAASYVFYAGWNPWYLGLIVYSTLLDFLAVRFMDTTGWRKTWLVVSLVNNLGLLAWFKYTHFLVDNVAAASHWLGWQVDPMLPAIVLPVGISFYTFQSMSYTIDFYRGRIPRERSFVRFATFVSFFPQLVAGPIERAVTLLPQLASRPALRRDDVAAGLIAFEIGFFKKVVFATPLARVVEPVYAAPQEYGAGMIFLATLAFAWQIYFDFSGYTDMARGVARMMGFRLMVNFRHPYLARNPSDFWGRWHISLSQWFRDYVYLPLGGSRGGRWKTIRNLLITFMVSGLWHGAAWTFLIWGLWHGLGVVVAHLTRNWRAVASMPKGIAIFATQVFVLAGWLAFRAESTTDLGHLIGGLTRWDAGEIRFPWILLAGVASVFAYQWFCESRFKGWLESPWLACPLVVVMLLVQWLVAGDAPTAFIYFQF